EPLAVRKEDPELENGAEPDWRRLFLNEALVTTGPVSDAAKEAVLNAQNVEKISRDNVSVAIPLVSGDRAVGVLEAVRNRKGARRFRKSEIALLEAIA